MCDVSTLALFAFPASSINVEALDPFLQPLSITIDIINR